MTAPLESKTIRLTGFRTRLLLAMMLLATAIIALVLYLAERNLAANFEENWQRAFQGELAAWQNVQVIRQAALVERCRALVRKPRIHAALEDNALDLLYPSAEDELRDVMQGGSGAPADQTATVLHAEFYRFLDQHGAVIQPSSARGVGFLEPGESAQLDLPAAPVVQQIGYLRHASGDQPGRLSEVIAMPIVSSESGEVIAAIALGFKRIELGAAQPDSGIIRGIWQDGQLHLSARPEATPAVPAAEISRAIATPGGAGRSQRIEINGTPHLLFFNQLNPGSLYPPAYEVSLYPVTELLARQRQWRWRIAGVAAGLLLGGLGLSHFLAGRLSRPVEKLAVDSVVNIVQRQRAEAALETTSEELQRAARFSADASHQLMTPVTVLRAGLEELLSGEKISPRVREEVSALIHQTYRLSNVIKDLLLLSRMDAGRLQIEFSPVNLTQLIEAAVDDLSALPEASDCTVETDFPAALLVAGEKRYLMHILQNLLENARKYNRPGGRIRIVARVVNSEVFLAVGNTGRAIPPATREHIFERFHRGAIGENVPGYGLGLNLARELARLHQGDVRLTRSDDTWTEFEARFRQAGLAPDFHAPTP